MADRDRTTTSCYAPIPTDEFFTRWNDDIESGVLDHGQTLFDLHGYFYGHGYHANPTWYASDCTHPNSLGHDMVRRGLFEHITGEPWAG